MAWLFISAIRSSKTLYAFGFSQAQDEFSPQDHHLCHNVPPPWPILPVGNPGVIHAFGQLSNFSKRWT